ncbi:MAG TPA: type II toxin-antitoxin system RelE/ParE family toxin [Terriglobales bacterium]|jgi:toxin ParE1/3/4
MQVKPAVLRALARRDVEAALDDFLERGEITLARRFVEKLELAIRHLQRFPSSGSPRHGRLLDLPDLRAWPVGGSGFLIFYLERPDHLDVWRVLHGARDIPAWLAEEPRRG